MLILTLLALGQSAEANPTPLTPRYEGNAQAPLWAPDGSRIAYEVNFHERKTVELYLITASGEVEEVRPAARQGSDLAAGFASNDRGEVVHELTWSPAALNSYVYSAAGSLRDYNLHLKGGTPVAMAAGTDGGPVWSPNGETIVFTSARSGQGDLYAITVREMATPPQRLTSDPDASELYPAWSPDSRSLAYVGHSNTGDNLYFIDDIGSPGSPRQLTTWQHMQTRPRFSPDGSHLAFYSNHEDSERFDLWTLPLGGSPRKLAEDVVMNHQGPVWLPNSSGILFVADEDERFDPLYQVNLSGERVRIPTGTVGNGDFDLAVLADGNAYLALAAQGTENGDRRDFKQVYVIPLAP